MRELPFIVLFVLGIVGAWVGWRVGTKAIYRRSDDPLDEAMFDPRVATPRQLRLKRRRVLLAVLVAWVAIAGGVAGMIYLVR